MGVSFGPPSIAAPRRAGHRRFVPVDGGRPRPAMRQMSRPAFVMRVRQQVRYASGIDGTRLAWAEAGAGPPLIKAANWLTHLEYELDSPVWRHWIAFFAAHFRFLRYDERGCGMSEWRDDALSLDLWADDLGAVLDAAAVPGPATLLGISQGAATCVRYAVRHPDRVARLILYGGYAHGA